MLNVKLGTGSHDVIRSKVYWGVENILKILNSSKNKCIENSKNVRK